MAFEIQFVCNMLSDVWAADISLTVAAHTLYIPNSLSLSTLFLYVFFGGGGQ